jgi:hypothetical protein
MSNLSLWNGMCKSIDQDIELSPAIGSAGSGRSKAENACIAVIMSRGTIVQPTKERPHAQGWWLSRHDTGTQHFRAINQADANENNKKTQRKPVCWQVRGNSPRLDPRCATRITVIRSGNCDFSR